MAHKVHGAILLPTNVQLLTGSGLSSVCLMPDIQVTIFTTGLLVPNHELKEE